MYVDFPAMFGPVMMAICCSWLNSVSLGTNRSSKSCCSKTGWRPSRMERIPTSLICGPNVIVKARRFGERTQDVQLSQRGRRLLDFLQAPKDTLADPLEQFVFQFHTAFFGAENLCPPCPSIPA